MFFGIGPAHWGQRFMPHRYILTTVGRSLSLFQRAGELVGCLGQALPGVGQVAQGYKAVLEAHRRVTFAPPRIEPSGSGVRRGLGRWRVCHLMWPPRHALVGGSCGLTGHAWSVDNCLTRSALIRLDVSLPPGLAYFSSFET